MPVDQAAGLRRHRSGQAVRMIHCLSESTTTSFQLMQALHSKGLAALLVDTQGRLFTRSAPSSLFNWKQQLSRGQLHLLPLAHGDGWVAPGVRGDEATLHSAAQRYDCIVFDSPLDGTALAANADHTVVIDVQPAPESMLHCYAMLKTLAAAGATCSVVLVGDVGACRHVRAACSHFLGQPFAQALYNDLHEDHAFSALAARMAGEETGRKARYITGTP